MINQPSPFRLPRLLYVVRQGVCNSRANYHAAQDQTSVPQIVLLQRVMIDVRAGFAPVGEPPNWFPQSLARQIDAICVHEFQLVVSQRNAKFVRMCDCWKQKQASGGGVGVPVSRNIRASRSGHPDMKVGFFENEVIRRVIFLPRDYLHFG